MLSAEPRAESAKKEDVAGCAIAITIIIIIINN